MSRSRGSRRKRSGKKRGRPGKKVKKSINTGRKKTKLSENSSKSTIYRRAKEMVENFKANTSVILLGIL